MLEYELVEIVVEGIDNSIGKKLDTQYLRDMTQLAERVRRVERLESEKAKMRNFHNKKKKVVYIEAAERDRDCDIGYEKVEENDVNVAELKAGPPYVCKLLKRSDGKNSVESKN